MLNFSTGTKLYLLLSTLSALAGVLYSASLSAGAVRSRVAPPAVESPGRCAEGPGIGSGAMESAGTSAPHGSECSSGLTSCGAHPCASAKS